MNVAQMTNVEHIKEEARRLEGYESWSEALELYQSAIAQLQEKGQSDPALYSRAGDLHLRLQRPEAAADCYEAAVDHYVSVKNLDNAFAVCQKILRHLPEREQVYLRVARIRAAQGLPEYARQHYLTYAKMRGDQGAREEAVAVLEELVGVVPSDLETRVFLADRLAAAGRRADALTHLHEGYRRGLESKDKRGLERLRKQITLIDPRAAAAWFGPGTEAFEAGLAGEQPEDQSGEERKSGPLSRLLGALKRRTRDASPFSSITTSSQEGSAPAWAPEPSVEQPPVREPGAERAAEPAQDEFEDPYAARAKAAPKRTQDSATKATPTLEDAIAKAAATLAKDALLRAASTSAEKAAATTVPEPHPEELVAKAAPKPVDEPVGNAESKPVEEAVTSPPAVDVPGLRLRAPEPAEAAAPVPPPSPAPSSDTEEAEVRALLAADPNEVANHERYVRWVASKRDSELLIEALLGMATALREAGLEWRARSTLARVLSMDPVNPRALDSLGFALSGSAPSLDPVVKPPLVVFEPVAGPEPMKAPEPPPAAEPASPTAETLAASTDTPAPATTPVLPAEPATPDEGYVDLAALIFDEPTPTTTRWRVAADAPTLDADADFARILTQFKEQVSSHLEHNDARAHYELGSAYREMGLLAEAIGMFQEALHADPRYLAATEMLGRTFLDKGDLTAAIQVLNRGLELDVAVDDDLLGIYYYLGNAYEQTGDKAAAKDFYLKVFALDINFIDVTERLRALR